MPSYLDVNRACWDDRASAHAASPGYAVSHFIDDPAFVSDVVRFDIPRLGDIRGLRGVHLQCHIGTDTISLARLGARMTGLDLSPESLAQARRLAAMTTSAGEPGESGESGASRESGESGEPRESAGSVEFVEAEVYEAVATLGAGAFDLVYTGVGALCWLPSIRRWAEVVAQLLAPGGRLFIREGHPMLWTLADPRPDGLLVVEDPYFEQEEPTIFDDPGTYVETDATFTQNLTYTWNHGLGEIITALLDAGMHVTMLTEHDSVPWEALPGQMEQIAPGEWRLIDRPWRLPHSYTLQASK